MYIVLGPTGQVGGAVLRTLRNLGADVRGVVRPSSYAEKASSIIATGASVATADMTDVAALARAFGGAEAVFVMNPPKYTCADMRVHAQLVIRSISEALKIAGYPRVVMLSSVGAQRESGQGNIATTTVLERETASLPKLTTLRAAWFMENWSHSLVHARNEGTLSSFLNPLTRAIPMVAAADIGAEVAALMLEQHHGRRTIQLHGPANYSPIDVALAAQQALGKPVRAVATERASWASLFQQRGFSKDGVDGWMEMLDGFNSNWMCFEESPYIESRRGQTTLRAFVSEKLHPS